MSRYHVVGYVHSVNRNVVTSPAGLSVQVLNPGTLTGVSFSTWNAASGGSSQGSSLTLSGNKFEFYTDAPQTFDLLVSATSNNSLRLHKDIGPHSGGDSFGGGVVHPITVNLTPTGGTAPEYGIDD